MVQGSLMIQGTTSDAGKSICVAGLCRVLKRKKISVAPFKPQNMALNSAVAKSVGQPEVGGEIGRAQALQAAACGLEPTTDFNPVLLKPSSDMKSQVIIHGQAVSELEARTFGDIKSMAFEKVLESYWRLKKQYDVVLIEGAGSPAEVNLRKNDIANMGFAEAVDCPVVLISDINRGGVFAHLTGTVNLLSESEQQRIKGFIINQFRGRIELLQSGLDWLEDYSNKKVLGVLPYLTQLKLDAEDAINSERHQQSASINIKVPVLPRISNHTDFDPLKWHPDVNLQFIGGGESLEGADLIILPGSKSVRSDLKFIEEQGWDKQIKRHLRYGGKLLGICGGFQMLGNVIRDPEGIESHAGSSQGLALFDFQTNLTQAKQLKRVSGQCHIDESSNEISGYEIHCGNSEGDALQNAFATITDQQGNTYKDGVISEDKQIIGTYIHGLFESKNSLASILSWISGKEHVVKGWNETRETELERLADCFEEYLDIDAIIQTIEN
ncbi:cobyric acid synthase [Aliikangiella coralliicola]|uniref:Cobyric acid synthase n=1 Tax=Aliikangiella coralliicola TaxID=2592383 RepID=A0A545UJI1_9GAMM|nr:cobyric acid synthase [Aliikangiella coralliicola]TQV89622.1 cobyric acid synthase [Aliikangiella coralliicola]